MTFQVPGSLIVLVIIHGTSRLCLKGPRPMMSRVRGPSSGGPRGAMIGHGPRPLLGRPPGPRQLIRHPAGTVKTPIHVSHIDCVLDCIIELQVKCMLHNYFYMYIHVYTVITSISEMIV